MIISDPTRTRAESNTEPGIPSPLLRTSHIPPAAKRKGGTKRHTITKHVWTNNPLSKRWDGFNTRHLQQDRPPKTRPHDSECVTCEWSKYVLQQRSGREIDLPSEKGEAQ